MFIDETIIEVKGGDGGNGCYAHLREKFRPRGGPSGGDGGRGGHVYFEASSQVHTLQDVSYHHFYKADRGAHGKGKDKAGKDGADITVLVPLGTVVEDSSTGMILHDCVTDGEKYLVAKGGRGGKGNGSLKSRNNPNPSRALPGEDGEYRKLHLTLKVLADVGLVGRPNAGKSTFLSRISRARPKVADYPFTTTEPFLGIVRFAPPQGSMVVADLPGLIENSHEGKGLGIRFLRHIERTRVLAFLIDGTCENPRREAKILESELRAYSEALMDKPRCFILTKADLAASRPPRKLPKGWLWMSAVTGENVDAVVRRLYAMKAEAAATEPVTPGDSVTQAAEDPADR